MRRLVFLSHVKAAIPLDAEKDGARSQGLVDGIDGSGQPLCALVAGMVGKERGDMGLLLLDACEDHPAFLVGVSFAKELPGRFGCCHHHFHIVIRPFREDYIMPAAGLREVFLEAVCDGKDDHLPDEGVLGTELVDSLTSEGGDLLRELLEDLHIMGEAAGDTDGLLGLDHVLEFDAGDPPELLPCPEAREMEKCPDGGLGKLRKVPGRDDAHLRDLSHGTPADAPDILRRELPKDLLDILGPIHVATTVEFGVFLAELGGNLGEGLRRGNTDGDRDGGLLPAVTGDTLCQCIEIHPLHSGKVQETLVDGVGLDGRGVGSKDLLNPSGHIPVEGEIGTEDGDVVCLYKGLQLEVGVTHLDAEGLRLVRSGHSASVVVGEHDDRPSVEFWTEDPFAGGEKVVAVGKGVHYCSIFLTTRAGTPTATQPAGMSSETTAPAPITAPSPMVTPGRMVTLPPIHTSLQMVTGFAQA